MTELAAGHVIAGRYRLEQRLGEGGMGAVWSARHLELRSRVAVKLIVPRHAGDPDMLSRFVREARAAAALRSPHVVQIFDSGIDDGLAYIVMEQLEGESLAERLERESTLSWKTTATVVTHVARAISRAHEANLVHRDLKPENIFLVQNEDELVAKVLDFGIAKVLAGEDGEPPSTRTETGRLVGSPYYMSPEQARGREVDFRSDLWALGVLAYECLIGERPFRGSSLGDIILAICTEPQPIPSANGLVPEGFDAWFARATARPVEERFQSARELASTLRHLLAPDAGAVSDSSERSAGSGSGPVPLRGTPVAVGSIGSTTGQPTSSEARRAAPAPRRRYWPVVAAAVAAIVVVALGFRQRAMSLDTPHTEHPARQAPATTAAVASPQPTPAPPPSQLGVAPAAPSVAAAMPSAEASARPQPRVQGSLRPWTPKAAGPATAPSAPAKLVKDPLSTRF